MTRDNEQENTYPRRDFVKKVVYTAPLIVTLAVKPARASSGSGRGDRDNGNSNNNGK
jgi:hypothetical protein